MIIYGSHTCHHAIKNRAKDIQEIYTIKGHNSHVINSDLPEILKRKIVYLSENDFLKHVSNATTHQNIAIKIDNKPYKNLESLRNLGQDSVIAILDGIVDPQNLGTIIRNAAAMNVTHIITQYKSSCHITPSAVKVASGGYEYVDMVSVTNITQSIKQLKSYGYWAVAFDETGEKNIFDIEMNGKICLIFGAEGTGIRRLVLDNSDFIVKIPTSSSFPTLNVSASVAIAFYESMRQKLSK